MFIFFMSEFKLFKYSRKILKINIRIKRDDKLLQIINAREPEKRNREWYFSGKT